MLAPFHLAFLVKDIASTREFYGSILGCVEGRSTDTWVDFDFFGNQISAHVSEIRPAPVPCGKVEDLTIPIPHFGAILGWGEFQSLAERVRGAGVVFIVEPHIRFEGKAGEQATMFLKDFSGNALEFKSFKHPEGIFETP